MNNILTLRLLSSDNDIVINKLKENDYKYWLNVITERTIDNTEYNRYDFIRSLDRKAFETLDELYNLTLERANRNNYLSLQLLLQEDNKALAKCIRIIYNISLTEQKQVEDRLKPMTQSSEVCLINGQKVTLLYLDGTLLVLANDKNKIISDCGINDLVYKFIKYYFKKTRNKNIKMLSDILEKNKTDNTYSINCFDELLENILINDTNVFDNTLKAYFNNKASMLFNNELIKYNNLKILLQMMLNSQKILKTKIEDSKNMLFALRTDNKETNKETFKEALARYPNISIIKATTNQLVINIDTLLKTWSKADLKILLSNQRSFVWEELHDNPKRTALFIDIMFNKKYIPRVTQDIRLFINGDRLNIDNNHIYNTGKYNRLCNPHINYHNCFGQAKTAAVNAFNLNDYDSAISQIISAVQSITVTDGTVFRKFIKMLFGIGDYAEFENSKFLIDRDGNEHSAQELLDTVYKDVTEMPDIMNLTENDVAKETL